MTTHIIDKRRAPRFQVTIFTKQKDLATGQELSAHTFDISATGIGLMTDTEIPLGHPIELSLCMPDNGEEVHASGKAVWMTLAGPHKYRVGINLDTTALKPIPLVLRTIRMRTRYYS
ncbi:MAG TPA: PilZ domain-containing protein [Candidatus Omnitrophota bacterium]|nr:PilZ domain-containing protein [Candidatus Omnitrophota bacterium]HRZ14169.1 PilZ domain-containing protein [Candidatus Omnitrophota bacterium]